MKGNRIRIWGADILDRPSKTWYGSRWLPVVFPVMFDEVAASVEFCTICSGRTYDIGSKISAMSVRHPGGALAIKLVDGNGSGNTAVYISDNELGPGGDALPGASTSWHGELVTFIRGAKVLIHDATYSAEEYPMHRGWGHSIPEETVELAIEAGVEQLVLFHHKPDRSDDEMTPRWCVARVS